MERRYETLSGKGVRDIQDSISGWQAKRRWAHAVYRYYNRWACWFDGGLRKGNEGAVVTRADGARSRDSFSSCDAKAFGWGYHWINKKHHNSRGFRGGITNWFKNDNRFGRGGKLGMGDMLTFRLILQNRKGFRNFCEKEQKVSDL